MDHSDGLLNAAKTELKIENAIFCWPHIKRAAIPNNRSKLFSNNYFDTAQRDISDLHLARTQKQFEALAELMLRKWRADRETALANWFEAEYLTEPYNHWSVTASGIPGVSPNQNPIESFHRNDKRDFFGQKGPVSLGVFIAVSIPTQLKQLGKLNLQGVTLQPTPSRNRYILTRVQELIEEEDGCKNYLKIAPGMKLKDGSVTPAGGSYVFNCSDTLWQGDCQNSIQLSEAKAYLNSSTGYLPADASWSSALQVASGFHYVYKRRNRYVCDCKAYWTSVMCGHQVVAMHLETDMMEGIGRGRVSGRPRVYVPLGYAAHEPFLTAEGEMKAASFIGVPVARYLRGDRERVYCGKIIGTRTVPGSKLRMPYVAYRAQYEPQFDDERGTERDGYDSEELDPRALKGAMKLYMSTKELVHEEEVLGDDNFLREAQSGAP